MGRFVFEVPSSSDPDDPSSADFFQQTLWRQAYLCGIEGVPFETSVELENGRLILDRRVESSAKLLIPFWIPEVGYRTITTCSLRPNGDEQPYNLPLEMARGSCLTARNQSDIWQRSGLKVDSQFLDNLQSGTDQFIEAAVSSDPVVRLHRGVAAIKTLQASIDSLNHQYCVQSIAYRSSRATPIGTMVGAVAIPPHPTVGPSWNDYQKSMNCIAIRTSWADIESDSGMLDFQAVDEAFAAAEKISMRIIAGPIIDFRSRLMPHWLYLLENSFDDLVDATVKFVQRVVQRYRGRVALWNAASSLNTPGPLPLSDEQAMRLTVSILQAVRQADPSTAAVLSFDQPCGEYLANHRDSISPMHFADAIARSGLGLSGLGLEYRMGYSEQGTLPRSSLDIGNSVERWATLGMPLLVTVVAPGGSAIDSNAIAPSPQWSPPSDELAKSVDADAWQLRIGGPLLRTLLAKPCVHGILWDGWDDRESHIHSHSGLIGQDGHHRRLYDYFVRLKSDGVI